HRAEQNECGLITGARLLHPAQVLVVQDAEGVEDCALEAFVAPLTVEVEGRLVTRAGLLYPALLLVQVTLVDEHVYLGVPVARRVVVNAGLFEVGFCFLHPPGEQFRLSKSLEHESLLLPPELRPQHVMAELYPCPVWPPQLKHRPNGTVCRCRGLAVSPCGRPPACRNQVLGLPQDRALPLGAPPEGFHRLVLPVPRIPPSVALLDRALGLRSTSAFRNRPLRPELLPRVFLEAHEHPEARFGYFLTGTTCRHPGAQETLIDEGLHDAHPPWGLGPRTQIDHPFRRLQREPAFEHRALRPRRPLPWFEQLP